MSEETKNAIRSMVQNLIKDNTSQAEMDIHPVFSAKMKEIAGIQTTTIQEPSEETINDDDE